MDIFDGFVSGTEAADIIGVSSGRISQICAKGLVECQKLGKFWVVNRESAEAYRDNPALRTSGKPRKMPMISRS